MTDLYTRRRSIWCYAWRQRSLWAMSIPGIVLCVTFSYLPMWGILISFKKYSLYSGFFASRWVGLRYFQQFFNDVFAVRVIINTFLLSFYNLLFSFPMPIFLALLLNEMRLPKFKKITQTITYLPHFISTVIIVGMLKTFFSASGIINRIFDTNINFFMQPEWFRPLYIGSGIWQGIGWGSIIYLAAIAGIDPTLYEAATIDGASRIHKMRFITLPSIANTIVVLLILNVGRMMSVGFEKVYLMYNETIYSTADVLSTYVYRMGLQGGNFGYGTAVGLFNSIVNLVLLFITNAVARKLSDYSLW
mgnify:CR=1 FL=1